MNEAIIKRINQLIRQEEDTKYLDDAEVVTFVGGEAKIRATAMREVRQAVLREMERHD